MDLRHDPLELPIYIGAKITYLFFLYISIYNFTMCSDLSHMVIEFKVSQLKQILGIDRLVFET